MQKRSERVREWVLAGTTIISFEYKIHLHNKCFKEISLSLSLLKEIMSKTHEKCGLRKAHTHTSRWQNVASGLHVECREWICLSSRLSLPSTIWGRNYFLSHRVFHFLSCKRKSWKGKIKKVFFCSLRIFRWTKKNWEKRRKLRGKECFSQLRGIKG